MKRIKGSDNLIKQVKEFEGLSLEAYQCSAGVWTIGYGHTRNVQRGDRIIQEMANDYLMEDLGYATRMVAKLVTRDLEQGQQDACIDFVFNLGAYNFEQSTLLKYINEGRPDDAICAEFRKWTKVKQTKIINGERKTIYVSLAGLEKRREAEVKMWLSHYVNG